MGTLMRPDRLWLGGGVLASAVVVALSWLLLIAPQNSETDSLRLQADQVDTQVAVLQSRLTQLRKENEKLGEYQAKLAAQRLALPTSSGMSDFLRGIQTAGENSGVSVDSVSAGTATTVTAAGAQIGVLPVSLTVAGRYPNLETFLTQLQTVQPRAVLVVGTNLVSAEEGGGLTGDITMTVSLRIFVAQGPSTGTGTGTGAGQPAAGAPAGKTG